MNWLLSTRRRRSISRFPTAGDAERELNRLVQEGRMVREEQSSTGGRPRTVFRWIEE